MREVLDHKEEAVNDFYDQLSPSPQWGEMEKVHETDLGV
jgi:hypothetical protein